ncbi:MAG: Homoserine O-acetyltransferase [Betaproteobacteria bacterium]|nr:Homoserine O-acetyltransferase [Betaproteobacteria bacterium]
MHSTANRCARLRSFCFLAALVLAPGLALAQSQTPAPAVQSCQLGDLKLESGGVIRNVKMTYLAFGTLNADKSNAMLSLHGLQGNRGSQSAWAGPGKAFDTNRYFVIQPDTLGVASVDPNATTSPTRSGLNMSFPRFNIRDMVNAEQRMLTECLGIKHIVAVGGISMGGIETMQWIVSYPTFMDAAFPTVPMARANRQGNYIWEAIRQVIMVDPKWKDGAYPNDDPPRSGIGVGLQIQSVVGSSASGFEEGFANKEQVHAALTEDAKRLGESVQARDWIYRSWAIQEHDIGRTPGFNGDLAAAARSVRARVILFPNCYDQLHPAREGGVLEAAQNMPNAKIVDLDDIGGHRGALSPKSLALFTTEVHDLLKRIADGRPGIGGPRIPRAWARSDFCGK